jgi:20S proteasome alpha/beta subunit
MSIHCFDDTARRDYIVAKPINFNRLPLNALNKKPTKRKQLTIVVGIKVRNGICVMCDSRTTAADGTTRDSAVKIHSIFFKDNDSILVARAGIDEFSSQLVDIMSAQAKNLSFNDYLAGAELARNAVIELKNQMREQYKGTAEEIQRHFSDHNFELMIAYYHAGKPYLFTVDFTLGGWVRRDEDSFSIGCGRTLADFLLYKINVENFGMSEAIWTGAYVIESVKAVDSRCGGPIRGAMAMWIDGKSITGRMLTPNLEMTVENVTDFAEAQRVSWNRTVEKELKKQMDKNMREQLRELKRNDYVVAHYGNEPIRADPETGFAMFPDGQKVFVPPLKYFKKPTK